MYHGQRDESKIDKGGIQETGVMSKQGRQTNCDLNAGHLLSKEFDNLADTVSMELKNGRKQVHNMSADCSDRAEWVWCRMT